MSDTQMTEKISVIVPVFQTEAFLSRCIRLIQKQTYGNLEIILVDDASPDRSYEIASAFAQSDKRIRLLRFESNQGLSAARNEGLRQATGEWIAFVDSDDCLPRDALECLVDAARAAQVNMSIGGYTVFYEGSSGWKREIRMKPQVFHSGFELQQYFLTVAKDYNYVTARLYRHKVFQNFQFPGGRVYEDIWGLPQILYAAQNCVVIDRQVYEYHLRPDSITGKSSITSDMGIVGARLENERFIMAQYPSLKPYVPDVVIEGCCFYLGCLFRAGRDQYKEQWEKTVSCIRVHLSDAALHTWMLKGMRPLFFLSPAFLGWCCYIMSYLKRKGFLK